MEEENKSSKPILSKEKIKENFVVGAENKKNRNFYLWLGIVLVLLVPAILLFGQGNFLKNNRFFSSPSPSPSVISPSPRPATPSPAAMAPLSHDDSLETMEKELNETPIDDFSEDLGKIEKDINSL